MEEKVMRRRNQQREENTRLSKKPLTGRLAGISKK